MPVRDRQAEPTTPLANKFAVVTGATRGIGRAIAARLLADGARVLGTGTTEAGQVPEGCSYYRVDFANRSATETFAEELRKLSPDILVNNAGINKLAPFADIEADDFVRIHQVNVLAPLLLCRAVVPGMRARGSGRIVNVCSIWSIVSMPARASYSASKFALDGLSAALAAEVAADNVLVNCVSPGFIDTEMLRGVQDESDIQKLIARVPMRRLGRPEEIASFVAWLVGPQNTFISGQNMAIDGGYTRV